MTSIKVTQCLMSQNTADATTTQRKQGISEAGREIRYRRAVCRAFCLAPTCTRPPGRTVAILHSIPNRSDWLCVKFPGSCHSNVSCVLRCHSTLLRKDDLSGRRSHTGCPQTVLAADGFCLVWIRFKILNWLLTFKNWKPSAFLVVLKKKKNWSIWEHWCLQMPTSVSHVAQTRPGLLRFLVVPAWPHVPSGLRPLFQAVVLCNLPCRIGLGLWPNLVLFLFV